MRIKRLFCDCFGLRLWAVLMIMFGLIAVFILFALLGVNKYERWICNNYSEVAGFEVKYIDFDSCYLKTAKGWIKYDRNIRINFEGEL